MSIKEDYPLKSLNTFHIDVKGKFFTEINNPGDLMTFINDERFLSVDKLVLGGGSNILFSGDFDGLILKNNIQGIECIEESEEHVLVKVGAGINWHYLVKHSLSNNWFGLENLALIPGTVGAAPIQNIGAYGVELKDFFVRLTGIEMSSGKLLSFERKECDFSYRYSIFKGELKNKIFITEVILKLNKKPLINIAYRALHDRFVGLKPEYIHPSDVFNAVVEIRKSKLPDPEKVGNGGSFFKNPVLDAVFFEKLRLSHPDIPFYDNGDGNIKIPAAYLIQTCGWKGYKRGDAGVHKYQALVLVNHGNARGDELIQLSKEIQASVYHEFQIRLEPEVNII